MAKVISVRERERERERDGDALVAKLRKRGNF
jgi:hypothetical protein